MHDLGLNFCLLEIFKVMHTVRGRLKERGVKIFYLVLRLYIQAHHALNVVFASLLAVIGKIPRAISHRVHRQDNVILHEHQDEHEN